MPVIKVKITSDMIGGDALIATAPIHYADLSYGEIYNAAVSTIIDELRRSHTQLGLYWACCGLVADNTDDKNWNSKRKVSNQCLIEARMIEGYFHYKHPKTGIETLQLQLMSIAFRNLAHIDACGYFTSAFQTMADKIEMTVDELIAAAKKRMRGLA